MTTFEQFLRDRYATLQSQRSGLVAQLKAVQKEIDEIEKASRASGLAVAEQKPAPRTIEIEPKQVAPRTMKEATVDTLRKFPDGLPATEILPVVNKLLGTDYPRSSLSPQLSRLKREGVIYDIKGLWKLFPIE